MAAVPTFYTPPRFVRPSGLLFRATPVSEAALSVDDVRTYQSILDRIGFPVSALDGRIGPQTRGAVRAYQAWRNTQAGTAGQPLAVDGILGPYTQAMLQADQTRTRTTPVGSVTDRTMARATLEPDASIPTNVPGATPIFTRSFMDPTINLGSNTATETTTNPLLVLGVIAGLATAAVAVARYYDDRRAR
jgi:peptidoglycan hydrolase-like protein with peptidoglycan-binding domain